MLLNFSVLASCTTVWPRDTVVQLGHDTVLHCTVAEEYADATRVMWQYHQVGSGLGGARYIYDSVRYVDRSRNYVAM